MSSTARYMKELSQARRIACDTTAFLNLLWCTAVFHLGNRLSFLNTSRRRSIRCLCNGRRLTVNFRQNTGDVLVLYEILGALVYRAHYEWLEPVKTIVDLGAHIGLATLYFATLFPLARLISVEPMPDNFALLKKNCLANSVHPTLLEIGVGASGKTTSLYRGGSSHQHSIVQRTSHFPSDAVRIEMADMSELIAENSVEEIDILKVDIEGAEGALFAESSSWISSVRCIIMEIHPGLVDYKGVVRAITANGFRYCPPGSFAPDYDTFLRSDVAEKLMSRGLLEG